MNWVLLHKYTNNSMPFSLFSLITMIKYASIYIGLPVLFPAGVCYNIVNTPE